MGRTCPDVRARIALSSRLGPERRLGLASCIARSGRLARSGRFARSGRLALAGSLALAIAACSLPAQDFEASVDGAPDGLMGLELAPGAFDLGEGQSADVTVRVTTPIDGDVTVTLGTTGGGLGLAATQVVLTPAAPTATVAVSALDDDDAQDGAGTVTANAAGLGDTSAAVTIVDDEELEIVTDFDTINISDITAATINVQLSARPLEDITVGVAMADPTVATASQSSLVFTPDSWNKPQSVSVVGVHDADAIPEASALELSNSALGTKSVVVNVTDSDMLNIVASPSTISVTEEAIGTPFGVFLTQQPEAGVTVTVTPMHGAVQVSPTSLDFSTNNYATPQTITVTSSTDDNVAGFTTTIRLTAPGTATMPALSYDVAVTVVDDDLQVLQLVAPNPFTVIEEQSASFTARLAFRPDSDTVVAVSALDPVLASVAPGALTFTTSDWHLPQTVVVSALHDNDVAPETTAVRLGHPSLPTVDLATTITDNDTLALVIPAPPTTVTEGATATINVSLNFEPTSAITVAIQSSNPGALAVPAVPLTFTPANYTTPQPVVVTAGTDANLADESVEVTLSSPGNLAPRVLPITIDDQTALTIVLSATSVAVTEQAAGQAIGVSLSNPPLGTVTVEVAPGAADVQVTPSSVSFGPSDWMTPKSVTIAALTDDDVAGETTMVTLSSPGNAPSRTVAVTITDDDVQAILAPGPINLVEGGTATIGVRLEFRPAANVDVTPSSLTGAVVSVPATVLTFTPSNWNLAQSVTVTGVHDADTNPATGTIRFTSGTMTTNVTVNVTDDDSQGIVVTGAPTTVNEGTMATFTVRLQAMPTATTAVVVGSNNGALVVLPPTSLSFTTANWSAPQTVTLSAPVDANLLNETVTINLSSPPLSDVNLTVLVDDQDVLQILTTVAAVSITEQAAGAVVGVSLNKQPTGAVSVAHASNSGLATTSGTLTFTTSDWATPKNLTISAPLDDDVAGGSATITLSSPAVPTPATITATVTDDDVQAILAPGPIGVTEGGTATIGVRLEFRPASNVNVTPSSLTPGVVTVPSTTVTFTPSNWNVVQSVTVTGVHDADTNPATGTIRFTSGTMTTDVAVNVTDDDSQGIVVTGAPTTVDEGTLATFTVRLQAMPGSTTTVVVSSNSGALAVSPPTSLSFTTANWNAPQTVTLSAPVDANLTNETVTITLSSPPLSAVNLTVLVDDQDVLQIVTSTSSVSITEQGAGATVGVSLNKQPTGAVTVSHASSSGLATTSGALTFSTSDWATPKNLTISAPLDDDTAGGSATITLSSPAVTTPVTITATVTDDDVQAIVEDAPATITTVEDAVTANDATFNVHLAFRPAGNVTVTVQSLNTAVATVSTGSLTFTTSNWSTDQTVRVHGAGDANLVTNTTTVRLSGPNTVDIPVTVTDNDQQVIQTNPTSVTVTEGGTTTLQVRLAFQPTTASTTVTLASSLGEVTVPSPLTFTSANYGTYQNVTVAAMADSDVVAETATITLANFDAPTPTTVPVTVTDTTVVTNYGYPTQFGSAQNVNNGSVLAYRINVPTSTTLDRLALIAAAVGGDFKLALYTDVGNLPGTLVAALDNRTTVSAVGPRVVDIADVALASGNYWIAVRAAPAVSVGYSGASPTATICSRNLAMTNLDTAWPATFGAATCSTAGILNLYIVTYT